MKDVIKGYIKPSIRVLAFLITFVILLEVLSVTYFSKAKASEFTNKYSETMSFFNEPADTLQVIAIGNSDLYSGFCPSVMWKQNGFTSTAIGSPRQTPNQSFGLLREVLSNQKPKVVIIECDMLYDTNPEESNIESNGNSLDVVFDYLKPESFEEGINNELPIFMFHDRWKNKKTISTANKNHGYKFSDKVIPVLVNENYMKPTDKQEKISKIYESDIETIIDYCASNGINVILTTFASPSSWTYERHNAVENLAKNNDVAYVDFNMLFDEIELDLSKDFRDKGNHLNYYGARKTTEYLGNYIAENYELEDLRENKDFEFWNHSVKQFEEQLI